MFEEPTINDFLAWVDSLLAKATDQALRAVAQIERDAARTGQTGNAIARTFEQVQCQFEAGTEAALGALKRAARDTKLDRSDLRQVTTQRLSQFAIAMKAITKADQMERFGPGVRNVAQGELAMIDSHLQFALRQFAVGFLNPIEPEAPAIMSYNTMNVGSMSRSVIQQGSQGASQNVSFMLNVETTKVALEAFENAIRQADFSTKMLAEVTADIETIRSQLTKAAPSHGVIQEAGKSIRKILEGVATGATTAGVVAAAKALYSAIGFG